MRSARLQDEEYRMSLASWWVGLRLSLDQEEDAKQTAAMVEGSPRSVMRSFVKYYEKLERWPEALTAMQNAAAPIPAPSSKIADSLPSAGQDHGWICLIAAFSRDKGDV